MDWLTDNKIPLGDVMETFVNWLVDAAAVFFDFIAITLETIIMALVDVFEWIPPLALIAMIAVGAWFLHRSVGLVVFIVAALLLIINLGYWLETIQTLVLVVSATFVSVLIGVPIGIAAAHRPWLYTILRPVLDLMQTIPTFVYLIPTLILFGLGYVPGLISTIIFAIAAPIRLTYLGVSKVPSELLEAGLAFGCTKSKLLYRVELPAAMPSIMAGVTQCIMLSLSMVVIAALVGADGLGKPVVRALNTVNISQGFEAGVAIVLVAIILDRICKTPSSKNEG
ncbi:choline ABC transporter permease subunit [Marinomonas mediterranea]|jgi:choline ABC transporter, permease protein|uniref:Choline ABC transporter, permease protein n=1 Tax=Marinomonas mediterranea (strain ATCC 700492 / JCM 21426 / NBRC 103028 / MMB-1) TaxID=717774 RepID=F2K486_MARM1|nr:choline ABC transporter permease subunit [Marinomonas mediterranea]ADZ92527.1 choline ABC transporter, permease protein [Marinomonas mediterranea MMB-1]WCN10473.1 choline ABC transporter permease subunit [Marinomonas mediterranea]WCN14521.1 choline ABC transporter permease subunit [Marinomonas mediterranea]WCN18572.1 choline ABC transporter permease subunit [Marinomonas mediterranea MMB-1]